METRYIISAQYVLVNGVGKGDILIYKDKEPDFLNFDGNCISISIRKSLFCEKICRNVKINKDKEKIIQKLGYGYDITREDIDKILKAVEDDILDCGPDTTTARTVTREIVKSYKINRFSLHVNVNNYSSKMILICYCGEEKKNEYDMRIYRGDICACGHNNWIGDYFYIINDLPNEVKNIITEKIVSLMKEMDEIKEPVFSLNREYTI